MTKYFALTAGWVLIAMTLGCRQLSPAGHGRVDLGPWPEGASPREIGERVARNFLSRPDMLTPQDGTIHYSEVCVWDGALGFARAAGDKPLEKALVERYRELLWPVNAKIIPQREHVDESIFGALPLQIYLQTGDKWALKLGKAKADQQWENPRADGLSRQTRFWIDDMYMITELQTQAYRATRDREYLDRAALAMTAYLDALQQTNGLFFHGERAKFFWGRGNGWMAAGMAELLRELPARHPQRARILQGYREMMSALLRYQQIHGTWGQLVDRPEAWPETSGSGMFTYAMISGVQYGWLDKDAYGPAARIAWLALTSYLNPDGTMREVCAGMGQRPDVAGYLNARRVVGDFHGQAPILWCATALMR